MASMVRWPVPISPLRLWLQSSSLLAVLAGYSLLLLFNQQLAGLQRNAAHRLLVEQLASELTSQARSREQLQALIPDVLVPGLRLQLSGVHQATGAERDRLVLVARSDQQWLVSRVPLALADGSHASLLVEQNVTASVQQEWLAFWLLLVGAGVASLFTSGLLRLVLRRGLVQPLQQFTAQLQAIQAPPSAADFIDVAAQPEELQPIAIAFNGLHDRLRASWERQRAFVDGVAHELRTPITLISGYTQSMLRRDPEAAALKLIRAEAERMGSLVSDLLDLARQDSGRLNLQNLSVAADEALVMLYERMAPQACSRLQLQLDAATSPAAEQPRGMADPDRLQQCLTTLVDNALQYSPAPSPVCLFFSIGPAEELVLHVRDHGPGVAPDERDVIFERFVRGRAALLSDQRGSGIGLSVLKLLMEAMGGRVVVADAPGGGADFQLWLQPFRPSASLPSP